MLFDESLILNCQEILITVSISYIYICRSIVLCSGNFLIRLVWVVISDHEVSQMQNSKLKKSMEDIQILEEKLQYALNENAKLKVKQKEDEKLWTGLESKFFSTKTLCEQLTETLQHLACQVQDGRFSFYCLVYVFHIW